MFTKTAYYTVEIHNQALGSWRKEGRFDDAIKASRYALEQAARCRKFVRFQVVRHLNGSEKPVTGWYHGEK